MRSLQASTTRPVSRLRRPASITRPRKNGCPSQRFAFPRIPERNTLITSLLTAAPEVCPDETPNFSALDLHRFVASHGRLPCLDDPVKPWTYPGWLLYYCQLGHRHPGVVNRWGYYLRTLEAGRLLDEPIPKIQFESFGGNGTDAPGMKMLRKALDIVFHDTGSRSAFPALVEWLAFGMGVSPQAGHLSEEANERLYRHVDLGPLLLCPYDYLGTLYAEGQGKWNRNAFFPTPHTAVECMTRMLLEDGDDPLADGRDCRTRTVCDPCVGSGRMLLHASNFSLCLYGADIDAVCCKLTAINGCLYAPWIAFPFPASIAGRALPPAPPAPLDLWIPEEYRPSAGTTTYRVDDRGQGLLFDIDPDASRAGPSRKRSASRKQSGR